MWDEIVRNSSMLGLIGSLITLAFNIFITRKTKKESARVYLNTSAFNTNALDQISKEKYANEARLMLTDKYKETMDLIKKADKEILSTTPMEFLEIENMSSNPCFGMKVKFSLKANNGKEENQEFDIYTMKGNEIVIIPLINDGGYETNTLEIIYNTIESETMKYESTTKYKVEKGVADKIDVEVTQTVYRKLWFGMYLKMFSTSGSGMGSFKKII
ncbi:hypothetical protein PDK45_01145 [Bacillus cereus]|nr:hypothetical protein [Bacillus cereus]